MSLTRHSRPLWVPLVENSGQRMSCSVTAPSQDSPHPVLAVKAWPSRPNSGQFCRAIPASELSVGSTEVSTETVSQPDVSLCPVYFLPLLCTCGGLMNTPSQTSSTVIPTSKSTFPGNPTVAIILWPFCRWGNGTFENHLPKVRKPFIGKVMTQTPNLLSSSLPSLRFTFPNPTSLLRTRPSSHFSQRPP